MTGKRVLTTITALRVVGVLFLMALPQFLSFKNVVFFVDHILRAVHSVSIVKNKCFENMGQFAIVKHRLFETRCSKFIVFTMVNWRECQKHNVL